MKVKHIIILILAIAASLLVGCRQDQGKGKGGGDMARKTATDKEVINWMQWGPEPFKKAQAQDKLILFDSGATWCHWCHVMDEVTYDDPEVIELLNERFIPLRIDRDRLPHVDNYFQRSVPLINSRGNGWPLTVVITPEGYVLYKATFLPPREDPRYGASVGMIDLLEQLEKTWRENRKHINEAAEKLRERAGEESEKFFSSHSKLSESILDEVYAGLRNSFDNQHGGFGGAPKFFNPAAIEFLFLTGWRDEPRATSMASQTLASIARGGVCDQIGGGFHRYSVDARWHVPHFEKMAYDNAAMLANYANAYAITGDEQFARVARETIDWIDRVLKDPGQTHFYASQDADAAAGDDGDYFTWTSEEVMKLFGDESEVVLSFYDIDPVGDMHGRPGRNVLFAPKTIAQHARLYEKDEAEFEEFLSGAKAAILKRRLKRPTPSVDKTAFADLNAMMIDAYLTAYQRLGSQRCLQTALDVLDNLLVTLRNEDGVFAHYRHNSELKEPGLLADQAWMARALVHAFAVTSDEKYLKTAETLADYIVAELTTSDGGFLNSPKIENGGPSSVSPTRQIEDSPTRSAFSVAAQVLLDIAYLTGRDDLRAASEKAMQSVAGAIDSSWGTFVAGFALSLDQSLNGPRVVAVIGPANNLEVARLTQTARQSYIPNAIVITLDPEVEAQALLMERLGYKAGEKPIAYVCKNKTCLAPAHTPQQLIERMEELKRVD